MPPEFGIGGPLSSQMFPAMCGLQLETKKHKLFNIYLYISIFTSRRSIL